MSFRPGSAPTWRDHARNFSDWFSTWASTTRNVRAIYDGVIPVALIDRFRDDNEGSLFAVQAATAGLAGSRSSVVIGSAENDFQLHALTFRLTPGIAVVSIPLELHLFTPIDPYNPVAVPSPVGFFQPGLITNKAFTFGSVLAVAGTNPLLPPVFGMLFVQQFNINPAGSASDNDGRVVYFDPPVRVYRDGTLALQGLTPVSATAWTLEASFLYSERPRAR